MKRIILGITWRDKKKASWIREQTNDENILITIEEKINGQLEEQNGKPWMVRKGMTDGEYTRWMN